MLIYLPIVYGYLCTMMAGKYYLTIKEKLGAIP